MSSLTAIRLGGVSPNWPSTSLAIKIGRPTSVDAAGRLSAPARGANKPTAIAAAPASRHRVMSPYRKPSALIDQREDRVERPENAGRGAVQRGAERRVDMVGGQVERHV